MECDEKEEYWSSFAGTFEDDVRYIVGDEINRVICEKIGGLRILGNAVEFGCGTGLFTPVIAGNADSVLATDLSDEMLDIARDKLAVFGNITVRKASCYISGLGSGEYDTVLIANTLHLLERPEAALREISRILKPGGRLVVVSYSGRHMELKDKEALADRFIERWGKPPYARNLSLEGLCELVIEAGFNVEESEIIGDWVNALYVVAVKV